MKAIYTTGLSKAYGRKMAVDHLEMSVPEGAIYGFIGQNGAGKSTTQKLICGLTPSTTGSIHLFGKSHTNAEVRSKVGMLIENAGLYPDLTAQENMMMYGLAVGLKDINREIRQTLELVGLSDTGKKKVRHFSLGMKQRLGIALALLGRPKLLILDEPINGLDPQGIIEFREIITKLNQKEGMTILISSHILGELSKIATHYGIINHGRMVKELSAAELEQTCKHYLCVKTERAAIAAEMLKGSIPMEQYELVNDHELHLFGVEDSQNVNRLLFEHGMAADEIYMFRQDLEDYFLNLMGGAAHA